MSSLLKKTLLCLIILTACLPFANAASTLKLEALPTAEVLPIESETCGCMLFPSGAPLKKENVLVSLKSTENPDAVKALLRIDGKTQTLASQPSSSGKDTLVNEYRNADVKVRTESRQVSYQKYCGSYTEPPTHGSCFLGTLTANSAAGNSQQKVTILCGC